MRFYPVLPLLLTVSMALSACEHNFDSVAKMNDLPIGETVTANLAAMVANPTDLVRGHGVGPSGSKGAANAIERLDTEHAKSLLRPGGYSGGAPSGG